MAITFQLPGDIEQNLRRSVNDLERAAKEAALVEFFRLGKLSHCELSQALGLDRFETDAILKSHQVFERSLTSDDINADRDALHRTLGTTR